MEKKYNYVYEITNDTNEKIYIGKHSTDNIDDGYMGSGVLLTSAINELGISHFRKRILFYFNTEAEALDKQKQLVNFDFVQSDLTYNISIGGCGSNPIAGKTQTEIDIINEKKSKSNLTRMWDGDIRTKQLSGIKCDDNISKLSIITKTQWNDPIIRNRRIDSMLKTFATNENRIKRSNATKARMSNPETLKHYRDMQIERMKNYEYKCKICKKVCINDIIFDSAKLAFEHLKNSNLYFKKLTIFRRHLQNDAFRKKNIMWFYL